MTIAAIPHLLINVPVIIANLGLGIAPCISSDLPLSSSKVTFVVAIETDMAQEHRGSGAGLPSTPSHELGGGHQPHHLKYGQVDFSGFLPDDTDDEEDQDASPSSKTLERDSSTVGADESSIAPSSSTSASGNRQQQLPKDAKSRRYRKYEREDAKNRLLHQQRRYLFRRPRALQYFRGNILVRSEEERSSHRLELFFDLVFVGLIASLAEEAIHEHNGAGIVRYILTYTAAWMIWNYMREIFNAFFVDDLPQRLLVLGVMVCLVVYGNNAPSAEQDWRESGARATAIGAYLIAGGAIFSTLTFYSFYVCQYRLQIRAQTALWLLILGLWVGSIFVSVRACIAMTAVALFIEYVSWLFCYSPLFKRLTKLRYSSAVGIEHEIERFNDFVTLVHGEFLYSVLTGQPAGHGLHSGVARVALTVVIAFVFHAIYCLGAGSKRVVHPIRRSMSTAIPWFLLHLPLVSALTLCGDSTAELVKENEVSQGVRWIFAVTYALSMFCTVLLVFLEQELDIPGELFFSRPVRVLPRLIAAIVVLLLPLADQEHINSTSMLGIAASLGGAAWMWQEFGALDGPNAPWYRSKDQANHDAIEAGPSSSGPADAEIVTQRIWSGFPTIVEPGAWLFDSTRQRGRTTMFAEDSAAPEFTAPAHDSATNKADRR